MDKRSQGILFTVLAVLFCGCPGLFLCLFGGASALGGGTFTLGADQGAIPPAVGVALICLSLIFIVIPVAVGFFTLRNKPAAVPAPDSNEPIPPAS